jgi:hypothetical protein
MSKRTKKSFNRAIKNKKPKWVFPKPFNVIAASALCSHIVGNSRVVKSQEQGLYKTEYDLSEVEV